MNLAPDDTICALATPPGRGGIGVIRVSGPRAYEIVDAATLPSRSWRTRRGHTLHRAVIRKYPGGDIDDVLLALFHAPKSYTGEDVVEIHAHGGPVPLRNILALLYELGAREAKPGEFTLRAFLNGKLDLAQAEAVADIIAADTQEAHSLAKSQQSGDLSKQVEEIRGIILGVLARIEASIDFPEDVGELDMEACRVEIGSAADSIERLLSTADAGILYREGARVVLAGRPNVGKSSLMNALLRTDRAIVTPIPGTTRDVIEEAANIAGIRLRLVDTAGVRETVDAVERIGVERTRASLEAADVALLVLDATAGRTPEDDVILDGIEGVPVVTVWNKSDLVTYPQPLPEGKGVRTPPRPSPYQEEGVLRNLTPTLSLERRGGQRGNPPLAVAVSALTGAGIDDLEKAIAEILLAGTPALDDMSVVVTHSRHRHALASAREHLANAIATIDDYLPADFISIDVRGALVDLGEITGATATEDIINEIFSRFCIGK